ncbi:uncharacterized protein PV09_07518 [Verruconis gallopava]|uniref:Major facilitator superfamily (MFS) profile domain-containing protein n=1 Tax=Verruconis gallopava TaxID=253628 RepID=A0A0D2A3M5_9PEZI|nr:uncharacterized protein PV09_07518 [Verruconis gallopava]KIW01000.1 hypothetical protein PV09_07518 [Verruconis gallopava]
MAASEPEKQNVNAPVDRDEDSSEKRAAESEYTTNGDVDRDVEKLSPTEETQTVEATQPESKAQDVEQVDADIVDFDGPDDPENPYNWTKKRKWINGGFLSFLTFITPLGSSMFAPGVPDVLREFHTTNETLGSFVVSIYILGYAFGPLFIAPLSEMYGRSIVYHVTNALFIACTIGCAASSSFGMLIGFRFLAGTFGSTPITIGSGTISDMFRTEERGAAMSIWSIGPLLGPVVGPIIGSYLSEAKGWRWDFWFVAIVAAPAALGMVFFLRETYAPVLLERKAARLRKRTGNMNLRSKMHHGLTPKEYMARSLIRPTKMLLFSPIVFFLSLYMAVVYGYLYLLFTTITGVFEGKYHFSPANVGLAYLGIGIGMFGGLFVTGLLSDSIVKKLSARNNGVLKPEYRIPPMIPAAFSIPIGLFMYGWTANYGVQYVAPIVGTSFVGLGLITTFMPIMTYLIDAYTRYAASVTAANTVLRSMLGALLPLAGPKMYAALGLGWGNSLLGFIALAMVPFPFVIWRYGEAIRTRRPLKL